MNIQRINKVLEAYQPAPIKRAENTRKTKESRDEINISPEARVYDFAKKAVSAVPDVREDKVAAIMKKIQNGTYNIPAYAIADKILE